MPARIRAAATAVAATLLATLGLSTMALGASAAAPAPAAVAQVISNLAYAPAQPAGSQGHLLDLYLPSGGTGPRPLVIWTSGSAWLSDSGKSGANTIAAQLNPLGWAVAGVSVRSSSQAIFPAQVFDIKAAIRWLRSNAAQYQLDPNRFAVMGDSSGGWETDMATLTGGVSALEGNVGVTGVSSSVQAGVGFLNPTDFLQSTAEGGLNEDAANSPESLLVGCAVQTCPNTVAQADPITYADANDPPLMLLHGQSDPVVPFQQSVLLYNALKAKCANAQLFLVPGAGHSTPDVMSSSHFGQQTVRATRNCQETTSVGSPNPSWDTIISFLRSALNIGGGPTPSASPTSSSATPSSTPSTAPSTTPPSAACHVADTVSAWSTGMTENLTITSSAAINGWHLTFTLPAGQAITSGWNATYSPSSGTVTATNLGYNAQIAPGGSTSLGFQGTLTGGNAAPATFALNGVTCL